MADPSLIKLESAAKSYSAKYNQGIETLKELNVQVYLQRTQKRQDETLAEGREESKEQK